MSRITSLSLGLMLFSFAAGSAVADDRPAGFIRLCAQDASCTVQTATNVAFGRDDRFTYRVLSGTFVCSAATFNSGALTDGECSVPSRLQAPARRRSTPGYGEATTGNAVDAST